MSPKNTPKPLNNIVSGQNKLDKSKLSEKTLSKEEIRRQYAQQQEAAAQPATFDLPVVENTDQSTMTEQFEFDKIEGLIEKTGAHRQIDLLHPDHSEFFDALRLQLKTTLAKHAAESLTPHTRVPVEMDGYREEVYLEQIPYILRKIDAYEQNYVRNVRAILDSVEAYNQEYLAHEKFAALSPEEKQAFAADLLEFLQGRLQSVLENGDTSVLSIGYQEHSPQAVEGGELREDLFKKIYHPFMLEMLEKRHGIESA